MSWKPRGRLLVALVVLVAAALVIWRSGLARHVNSNALWHVVHDLCVRDQIANRSPTPCKWVDLQKGYAVLRDERGATQVLVIPTAKVSGLEDPVLLRADAPNYWLDAWDSRTFVERLAGRPIPRDDIGLAINSFYGRSQDQLHIHVDCIDRRVRWDLDHQLSRIGPAWTDRIHLSHRDYRAIWIPEASLATSNLFRRAADGNPSLKADPTRETLALLPSTRPNGATGFVLIAAAAGFGYDGHAESLLDHRCDILR